MSIKLLPGITILERFIAEIRSRMEAKLWRTLTQNLTLDHQERLNQLLVTNSHDHQSVFDKLRKGPVRISASSLVKTLQRVEKARAININPSLSNIPPRRIAALARFANTAKMATINRLPSKRKMATLIAFAHHLEASAQDDALDVLSLLLRDLFSKAKQTHHKKTVTYSQRPRSGGSDTR